MPYSNPVSGPILVRGIEPGDALRIATHRIESLQEQCETYVATHPLVMPYLGTELVNQTRLCPIDEEGGSLERWARSPVSAHDRVHRDRSGTRYAGLRLRWRLQASYLTPSAITLRSACRQQRALMSFPAGGAGAPPALQHLRAVPTNLSHTVIAKLGICRLSYR